MASIQLSSSTETSLTCYVSSLDSSWARPLRFEWFIDGSFVGSNELSTSGSSSPSYKFTGLTSGTTYRIGVDIYTPVTSVAGLSSRFTTDEEVTTEPSIRTFRTESIATGTREIKFYYKINDWDDRVYGKLLLRHEMDGNSYSTINIESLDSSGYFSYSTSRYGNYYASLRITNGKSGGAFAELKCNGGGTLPVMPSW